MTGKSPTASAASAVTAAGAVAAVVTGAVALGRRVAALTPTGLVGAGGHADPARWRAVTVYRPLDELRSAGLGPLDELGDAVEVRLEPAPGDRGTEVHARLTGREQARLGERPLEALRSALREAKQVAEAGEVLQAGPVTTERTLLNRPLEAVLRRAGGEGRL